ncbi:uncharacterized protein LOC117223804 [Megalopta genalis]|uniref:uncharacterized protein LOC117223804 n=1 Tax=Megalopta genalis TaxID=115081 RepID=UPI003FD39881
MAKFPEDFADRLLELHNRYRQTHNSPPLEIIDELSESAQKWADRLAEEGMLVYKSDPDYGENIFAGFLRDSPENAKPEDPIELWYREGRYFKYGEETPKNVEDVRHFTQLVWKATTSLGIGTAIGDDKETYIVCFYQPPGNVPEEFAANVLAPVEEGEAELLPREAEEIRTVDIPPKIIESMERLYAVPSEKLRVWSAWLTKITEMTDEWQQWLRSHIDLAIRIAERLEEAREVLRKSETAAKDKPGETLDEGTKEKKEAASQSVEEEPADPEAAKSSSKTTISVTTVKTAASSMGKYSSVSGEPRSESSKARTVTSKTASQQTVQKQPSATGTSKSEPEEPVWPVGVPWTPEEEEEEKEVEEDVLQKLSMPRNEAEMKEYLKKFKDEAVLYRSYYKHWRETADQTMSEVGGRLVMATFLVQGKREEALKRIAKTRAKDEVVRRQKVKAAKRARLAKKPSVRSTKSSKSAASTGSVYVTPPESLSQAVDDPAEEIEPAETVKPAETAEPAGTDETPEKPAESDSAEKLKSPVSSKSAVSKVPTEKETEPDEALRVDELFRDCARACEPIPYHFYLRCEPDVELAGVEDEHDEILEIDLTSEKMLGTLRRVWYNLAEKPCKGGKPWI